MESFVSFRHPVLSLSWYRCWSTMDSLSLVKRAFFFFLRIKLTDSSRLKTFRTLPDRLSKMWTYALKRFSHEWPQFLSLLTIAIAKRVVELAGSYVDTREVVVCCPCIFPYLSDEALLFVITCQLVFFYLGKILLGKSPICWQDGLCFNRACVRGDPLNFQPKIQQMVIEFRHPCCSFPGLWKFWGESLSIVPITTSRSWPPCISMINLNVFERIHANKLEGEGKLTWTIAVSILVMRNCLRNCLLINLWNLNEMKMISSIKMKLKGS